MLILPAEAPEAQRAAGSLKQGDEDQRALHARGLVVGNLRQVVAVDGFDKAIAEQVQRRAKGRDQLRAGDVLRHMLLGVGEWEIERPQNHREPGWRVRIRLDVTMDR